jgi:hypothetical protein
VRFLNDLRRQLGFVLTLALFVTPACAQQSTATNNPQTSSPAAPKPEFFLAGNPNVAKTLAFINDALASKLRYIGQHNPAGKVLLGKSLLHLKDESRHLFVKVETPVLEDMSNGSGAPRSHMSVATALRSDLNIEAASSNGDYVVVPCKTGKKCVDNRLLLSSNHQQAPASLPGLGTLMTSFWAPPSMLVIGPFPEGQAQSMVPVVQYLLSR